MVQGQEPGRPRTRCHYRPGVSERQRRAQCARTWRRIQREHEIPIAVLPRIAGDRTDPDAHPSPCTWYRRRRLLRMRAGVSDFCSRVPRSRSPLVAARARTSATPSRGAFCAHEHRALNCRTHAQKAGSLAVLAYVGASQKYPGPTQVHLHAAYVPRGMLW